MFVKYLNITYIYFGDPIQLEGMMSKEVDSPSTPFAHGGVVWVKKCHLAPPFSVIYLYTCILLALYTFIMKF